MFMAVYDDIHVSTDRPKEGTDKQKVSTDKEEVSTDRPDEEQADLGSRSRKGRFSLKRCEHMCSFTRFFNDIKARIEAIDFIALRDFLRSEEQFTIEKEEKFLHDTIAVKEGFLLNWVSSPDEQYSEVTLEGIELILWGDLKDMIDGTVIHMLVERRYPLSKDLLQRMLDFVLEVEVESTAALDLISLIPGPQSQENVPHSAGTVTTLNELDFLFSPMFDELLNGTTQVVSKSSAVTTTDAPNQRQQQHTNPSTSTTIAADTQRMALDHVSSDPDSQCLTMALEHDSLSPGP
ncbi:hypothetical protein Tco_0639218 [Tanacetum coccineum]